jgi:outer membrane protein assembly factor BamB
MSGTRGEWRRSVGRSIGSAISSPIGSSINRVRLRPAVVAAMTAMVVATGVAAGATAGTPAAVSSGDARMSLPGACALPAITSASSAAVDPARCATVAFESGASGPAAPVGTPCVSAAELCPTWATLHDGKTKLGDWASASAMDRAGTRLFTAGYTYTSASSASGLLVAHKASDGTELWSVERAGTSTLPVTVFASVQASADGSRVFVVGSAFSGTYCQPVVASYDGATGKLLWDSSLPVGAAPCEYYADSALTHDGKRFVIMSNAPSAAKYQGQVVNRGIVAAFDSKTGKKVWETRTPTTSYGTKNWRLTVSPDGTRAYVVGDKLVASSATTTAASGWVVTSYNVKNGKRLWSTNYDCNRDYGSTTIQMTRGRSIYCTDPSAVVVIGSRVVIEGSNAIGYGVTQVAAFAVNTGKRLWHVDRDPLQSFIYLNRGLAVSPDGTALYEGHVRIDPNAVNPPMFVVERMNPATGAEMWTQTVRGNTSAAAYCGGCGPLVGADAKGHVYLAGSYPLGDGLLSLSVLDAKTGSVNRTGYYAWSPAGLEAELPQGLTVPAGASVAGLAGVSYAPSSNTNCPGTCFDAGALLFSAG